ncbi:MAG: hypothetical protein IPI67_14320 [Myxococcales bacterium]|nr:hypothetical protein [Myxococcales bacterium]
MGRARGNYAYATGLALFGVFLGMSACGSDDQADALKRGKLAEGCLINTDCKAPLVCAFQRCHQQCQEQRDCEGTQLCVPSNQPFKVCFLEDEQRCNLNSDCPERFLCAKDGNCHPVCKLNKDCAGGQECISGVCAASDQLVDGGLPVSPDASSDSGEGLTCVYNSDCEPPLVCLGGSCLHQCKANVDCSYGWTCASGTCLPPGNDAGADGAVPNCQNGQKDPGETDIDCGGSCGACANESCTKPSECASHVCTDLKCQTPSCSDGLQNGGESDVDCGGPDCSKCGSKKGCWAVADCTTGSCVLGVCSSASCSNNKQDGNETATDCGGSDCAACADGQGCLVNPDCTSGNCVQKVCKPAGATTWAEAISGVPMLASDPQGNLVVGGDFNSAQQIGGVQLQPNGQDIFLAKYTPAGAPIWVLRVGGTGSDSLAKVGTDSKGDVLIVASSGTGGSFGGPTLSCGSGLVVAKYSGSNGNHVWSRCIDSPASSSIQVHGGGVAPGGDVIAAGSFYGTVDFGGTLLSDNYNQGYVARYSGVDGSLVFAVEFEHQNGGQVAVREVAADGQITYAVGSFLATTSFGSQQLTAVGSSDMFVAALGADGSTTKVVGFGDTGSDVAHAVSLAGAQGLVVTGEFHNQTNFGTGLIPNAGGADVVLLSLDKTTLAPAWAKGFGSTADDRGVALSVRPNGEIALAAFIGGAANFGTGPLTWIGNHDGVFARFSTSGATLYAKSFGGLYNDEGTGVAWVGSALGIAGIYSGGLVDPGTGNLDATKSAFFGILLP